MAANTRDSLHRLGASIAAKGQAHSITTSVRRCTHRQTAALLQVLGALVLSTSASAATIEYQAITDFPAIDAGAVPYYRDLGDSRNVLAINAANDSYRDLFARATVTFDGVEGHYDVTVTTLSEIDGDTAYQVLVNGELIGQATNAPTAIDYAVQQHTFENVFIPAGAELAVESKAVSNGLIPEGDAFAFARGRWRTLTLEGLDDGPGDADQVDLGITLSSDSTSVSLDESIDVVARVSNPAESLVATSPSVVITLPSQLAFESSDDCSEELEVVRCVLAELAPGAQLSASVTLLAQDVGDATVTASVNADQQDPDALNNIAELPLTLTSDTGNGDTGAEGTGTSTGSAGSTDSGESGSTTDSGGSDGSTDSGESGESGNSGGTTAGADTTGNNGSGDSGSDVPSNGTSSRDGGGGALGLLLLSLLVARYSRSTSNPSAASGA